MLLNLVGLFSLALIRPLATAQTTIFTGTTATFLGPFHTETRRPSGWLKHSAYSGQGTYVTIVDPEFAFGVHREKRYARGASIIGSSEDTTTYLIVSTLTSPFNVTFAGYETTTVTQGAGTFWQEYIALGGVETTGPNGEDITTATEFTVGLGCSYSGTTTIRCSDTQTLENTATSPMEGTVVVVDIVAAATQVFFQTYEVVVNTASLTTTGSAASGGSYSTSGTGSLASVTGSTTSPASPTNTSMASSKSLPIRLILILSCILSAMLLYI